MAIKKSVLQQARDLAISKVKSFGASFKQAQQQSIAAHNAKRAPINFKENLNLLKTNPAEFRRGVDLGSSKNPFANEVAQMLSATGARLAGGVQQRSAKDVGLGVVSTGATALGLAKLPLAAGFGLMGGGINAAVAKYQGGDASDAFSEGFQRSLVRGVPMAGVSSLTNPLIANYVPKAGGLLPQMITNSGANVAEGLLMDKAAGFETTKKSVALDAAMGALTPTAAPLRRTLKAIPDKVTKIASKLPPETYAGAFAGTEWDEDGKLRYNPVKGLLGAAGGYGIGKLRGSDNLARQFGMNGGTVQERVGLPKGFKMSSDMVKKQIRADFSRDIVHKLREVVESQKGKALTNVRNPAREALIKKAVDFAEKEKILVPGEARNVPTAVLANEIEIYGKRFGSEVDDYVQKMLSRKTLRDSGKFDGTQFGMSGGTVKNPKGIPEVGGVKTTPQLTKTGETLSPEQQLVQTAQQEAKQQAQEIVARNKVVSKGPSATSIALKDKYAYNINKKTMGLEGEGAQKLDDVVNRIRPILEQRKGKPLSNKEIVTKGRKAVVLDTVLGRDEAAEFAGKLQATRNYLKTASEQPGVTPEYLAQLEILSSTASDTGRRLRSFAVNAEDVSIKELVLDDLRKIGIETERILEASKGIDWNDAKAVTAFYRQFKPASFLEKLEEFRYVNMLSSPNTHSVNTFSNFLQTAIVAPVQKTLTGTLDFARARLTGTEQKYFARQGVDYAKGYWKSLPEAWGDFKKTMGGEGGLRKPDVNYMPTGTGKLHKAYTTPLRFLEAEDQFFRKLVMGGEMEAMSKSTLSDAMKLKKAARSADYMTFRQAFDPDGKMGQGVVLKTWDKWNSAIGTLRNLPGGRWIVPFLQTPSNILKQGFEFSPLGVSTMVGAKEPMEQLSKAVIGTTVFVGAYSLADAGLTTWDAPINKKERDAFYAAGLQPYSVKMGDKWVSYSKLGPMSYPLAMAAAMKWAKDNKADEGTLATIGDGMGGVLQFFADQSFVQGIGDVIDAIRGDEYKQGRALANIPSQLIPYRAFQGWLARLIDPVYRKTSGGSVAEQVQKSIMSQTPFLSKQLEPYTTPLGEPSPRQFPKFNAISPLTVSEENAQYRPLYDSQVKVLKSNALVNKANKELKEGKLPGVGKTGEVAPGIYALPDGRFAFQVTDETGETVVKTAKTKEKAQAAVDKSNFEQSDEEYKTIGDTFYYKEDGVVKTKSVQDIENKQYDLDYTLKLEQAKRNDDLDTWFKTQDAYLDRLQKEYNELDPNNPLDAQRATEIENKVGDILEQYGKYKGYGGFTKPKKPKKLKAVKMENAKLPKAAKSEYNSAIKALKAVKLSDVTNPKTLQAQISATRLQALQNPSLKAYQAPTTKYTRA